MIYGYARVSTADQKLDRQIDALKKYGIDTLYCEKMSGTKKNRPELDRLLSDVNEGDTIVIESLSRLGRSVKNLSELMETFNGKQVRLVSLKETIDTHSATGRLLYSIISSLSQFERDVLAERTKEGLNAARARGRLGGRPKKDIATVEKAVALYNTKQYSLSEIADLTGVSTSTLYRYIKKG
ncbi:MAG: recombinase family protein [Eubacteriales bacterium]|nr:recombinase family protein [Eubacteriales bacterium]